MCLAVVAALLLGLVAEIAVMVGVADRIGWLGTFALLLLSALAGLVCIRHAGWSAWAALSQSTSTPGVAVTPGEPMISHASRWRGRQAQPRELEVPKQVANSALTLVGGVLLLLPGFISDLFGLVCVLPPTRMALRRQIVRLARQWTQTQWTQTQWTQAQWTRTQWTQTHSARLGAEVTVIDGETVADVIDDQQTTPPRGSVTDGPGAGD